MGLMGLRVFKVFVFDEFVTERVFWWGGGIFYVGVGMQGLVWGFVVDKCFSKGFWEDGLFYRCS